MKKLTIILILIWSLSLTGCSKDTQVNAFIKEYASVTSQVAEKLNEGDAEKAREIFEAKKGTLKEKWDAARTGLPFQYSTETKKRMKTEPEENMVELSEAANNAIKKNPKSEAQIQSIVLDLANIFR